MSKTPHVEQAFVGVTATILGLCRKQMLRVHKACAVQPPFPRGTLACRNISLVSTSPMFLPSLSWQILSFW
jgi:hypothetical protein